MGSNFIVLAIFFEYVNFTYFKKRNLLRKKLISMNNNLYLFLAILSAGVGMAICRLLPFIIFANGKLPKLVKFYEKYLTLFTDGNTILLLFCKCKFL